MTKMDCGHDRFDLDSVVICMKCKDDNEHNLQLERDARRRIERERDALAVEAAHWKAEAAKKNEELAKFNLRFQDAKKSYDELMKRLDNL